MGSSYQSVLVVADSADVIGAAADLDAYVVPVGVGRTALIPRENAHGYADAFELAARVSAQTGHATVANDVFDSDVVVMAVFRQGLMVHRYVSTEVSAASTDDIGSAVAELAACGIAPVDPQALTTALLGDSESTIAFLAETRHQSILAAMNIDPAALTTAFRWVDPDKLPGAVRVRAAGQPPRFWLRPDRRTVFLAVVAALPLKAHTAEVGHAFADAISKVSGSIEAFVATAGTTHVAGVSMEINKLARQVRARERLGVYYAALSAPTESETADASLIATAQEVWTTLLRQRYDTGQPGILAMTTIRAHQFEIGAAAADHSTTPR